MKLSALISPGARELIERLRPHIDVAVDLFDTRLTALLPDRPDPASHLLRRLVAESPGDQTRAVEDSTDARARLFSAIRTASAQVFTCAGLRIGGFPLRHERTVVGILVTADLAVDTGESSPLDTEPDGPGTGASTAEARLERLGRSLRSTLETDIDLHHRLEREKSQSRWLSATLRFFEHLHTCGTEREMADQMTHAAAIWGDVDARLYRRASAEAFELYAALPGGGRRVEPTSLPVSFIEAHQGPTRITSIAELEQLGWIDPHGEVLFMPVAGRGRRDWLLVVGGQVEPRFERVLAVACRTLGLRLETLAAERTERLRQRLRQRLLHEGTSVPVKLASALSEIASQVGATRARLLVSVALDRPRLVLAEVGGRPLDGRAVHADARPTTPASHRMAVTFDVGLAAPASIELEALATPFDGLSRQAVEGGAPVFGAWLAGTLQGLGAARPHPELSASGSFESRLGEELERARRFGLTAGVVVIDAKAGPADRRSGSIDPLAETVRQSLRASDAIGRLRGGELAALLFQADAAGLDVVTTRLADRLTRLPLGPGQSVALGAASYPAAGETVQALVRAASGDRARRIAARTLN